MPNANADSACGYDHIHEQGDQRAQQQRRRPATELRVASLPTLSAATVFATSFDRLDLIMQLVEKGAAVVDNLLADPDDLREVLREVLRPLRPVPWLMLREEELCDVSLTVWSTSFSSSDSRRTFRLRGLIESTKDRMLIFVAGESIFAVRKPIAKFGGSPVGRPENGIFFVSSDERGLRPSTSFESVAF